MSVMQSPISHSVSISRLPQRGLPVVIVADGDQRRELAAAHGLLAVEALRAELVVSNWKRDGVKVAGRVRASIQQPCVVTTEPIDAEIDEEVSAFFLPEDSRLAVPRHASEGEILLDPEGEDAPELFSGDTIDVGALAEEFFELGIDPYARKQGASFAAEDGAFADDAGPLAEKLRQLRDRS